MKEHPLVNDVKRMVIPILESVSVELWGIRVITAKQVVIQIFIDSQEGVTVESCSEVSRRLSLLLDEEENRLCLSAYVLEVSTPGVEKYFFCKEQLVPYVGSEVKALLNPVKDIPRRIKGVLCSLQDGNVVISTMKGKEQKEYIFPWDVVESVQLVYSFNRINMEE
ncbi:MAG: ribosome maturation factor RimP [Desulfovibrionaceae bacterium]